MKEHDYVQVQVKELRNRQFSKEDEKAMAAGAKRKINKKLLNQIIHADCFEIFPNIPNGSIDMIFCDLPYGTTRNPWDVILPFDQMWFQYERIIKDKGPLCFLQNLLSIKCWRPVI